MTVTDLAGDVARRYMDTMPIAEWRGRCSSISACLKLRADPRTWTSW